MKSDESRTGELAAEGVGTGRLDAGFKPTGSELDILRLLWERGPSTVRDVHEVLGKRRQTVYTTILKLMQIMHGKGLLSRDVSKRSHVYSAAVSPEGVQDRFVDSLVESTFGGSASRLAMHALARNPASKAEIAEIRELLDTMEQDDPEQSE